MRPRTSSSAGATLVLRPEIQLKVFQDSAVQVRRSFGAADAMGLAWVELQIVGQVSIDQLLDELDRILHVYVVIPVP